MRLFEELLPAGASAVINADSPQGGEVARRAAARGLKPFTVGRSGDGLKLIAAEREAWPEAAVEGSRGASPGALPPPPPPPPPPPQVSKRGCSGVG